MVAAALQHTDRVFAFNLYAPPNGGGSVGGSNASSFWQPPAPQKVRARCAALLGVRLGLPGPAPAAQLLWRAGDVPHDTAYALYLDPELATAAQ